ncbi:MAG: hypothetical protein ACOX3T_04625 [Bdellovibrionota bacterium]
MDDNKSLSLLVSINDLFKIESSIAVSNNSEAFKAIEIKTGRSVIVSILKRKFDAYKDVEDAKEFLERLRKIKSLGSYVSDLINFGVDKDGVGYSISKITSTNSILSGNISLGEASRRFEAMLSLIRKLHKEGIILGDISNDTFYISRDGNIGVLALNGSYPTKNVFYMTEKSYLLPSEEEPISKASDIYRFGILCYKLFLNDSTAYPFDDNKNYIPVSMTKSVPRFIDIALKTCLSETPKERFSDVEELYNYIKVEKEKFSNIDEESFNLSNDEFKKLKVLNELTLREEKDDKHSKHALAYVIGGVFVFLILILFMFLHSSKTSNKNVVISMSSSQTSKDNLEKREAHLKRIYDSEDPVTYVAIVNMAAKAPTPQQRELVEKYILKRFVNYRFDKMSVVLREFFNGITQNIVPDFYEKLLLSLDKNYPIEKRITLFKELVRTNRSLIVNFAFALSLDTNDTKGYREIFTYILDDQYKEDISRRTFDALVIAEYTAWEKYKDILKEKLKTLSDEDLIWELQIFVKRNDMHLGELIDLITKRELLDNIQTKFLSLVNELRPPREIKNILLSAGTAKITRKDIGTVSNWLNVNKVKVFYVMLLALKNDDLLKREIFDVLSLINLESEATNNYIRYAKQKEWDNRGDLATLIPYMQNYDDFSDREILDVIKFSIRNLSTSSKQQVLTLLIKNLDDNYKKLIMENFYNELGIGTLVNYLSYSDKTIKKMAIKGLKEANINDVIISNLIINKYEDEDDEELRELYRESFWFIKKRGI